MHIYLLRDPITYQVRYIGKGEPAHRLANHIGLARQGKLGAKFDWIRDLMAIGTAPIVESIEIVTNDNWKEREQYWIKYYREQGAPLTNASIGGEGASGFKHSLEEKIKRSERAKGNQHWLGKKHSEETKAKLRVARARQIMSEETKRKISDTLKGRQLSQIHKANIAKASKLRMNDEMRLLISRVHTGKIVSEETKTKMSESQRKRWMKRKHVPCAPEEELYYEDEE